MSHQKHKASAPLIVDEGTLVHKRDMIRALETFECLTYTDMVDEKVMSEGEGILLKVFASKESSTLVINGSIFINVLSFDHLHFQRNEDGDTVIDLVQATRTLRLVPREENPKLMTRLNQESFAFDAERDGSEDTVAQQLLDDLTDIDEDESN